MKRITVAAVQMYCNRPVEENITEAEARIREAAAQGAQIILLPELFENRYFCQERNYAYYNMATSVEENPAINRLREVAREWKVVLPVSFYEKDGNVTYNSVAIIDADGSILGVYRKTHIPDDHFYQEKFYFTPGNTGFRVWDTAYGRIGVGICWDQWFPEAARINALKGADVLIYPTAIGWDCKEPESLYERQKDSWMTVMRGHAIANRLFVVAANRIGTEDDLTFWGHSFVSAPDGFVIEDLKSDFLGASITEIDLSEIEFNRRWWPHFRDRRTDLYKDILKTWDTP